MIEPLTTRAITAHVVRRPILETPGSCVARRGAADPYAVIPKLNDSRDNLVRTADLRGAGHRGEDVQLLPYHNMGRSKYERIGREYRIKNLEPPSEEYMDRVLELFRSYGLPAKVH